MPSNIAVVAGATGLVGRYLLNVLCEDAYFDKVLALVRRPLQETLPRVRALLVDYENLPGWELRGATHLFCCLGTTMTQAGSREAFRRVDYDYAMRFCRAGKEAGARCLMLVSSVGASTRSLSFYLRVKGELEVSAEKLRWESFYCFRPGLLLGKREQRRPGEEWAARLARATECWLHGSLEKYRPMPAGMLAAALAAAGERGPTGRHIFHYPEIARLAGFGG